MVCVSLTSIHSDSQSILITGVIRTVHYEEFPIKKLSSFVQQN